MKCICILLIGWIFIGCDKESTESVRREPSEALKINYNLLDPEAESRYEELITDLNSFLQTKNRSHVSNPYWLHGDFEKYTWPYKDILGIEHFSMLNDSNYFKPTLLNIIPTGSKNEFIVKLAFVGCDSAGRADVRAIYNIAAIKQNEGYKFHNVLDYNTAGWHKVQIGTIKYIYRDTLNRVLAEQNNDFNINTAAKFKTEPIEITYYKCRDPIELSQIKGFDYSPVMYLHSIGGRGETWSRTLFAGNNSEWYPREIIPFYIRKVYGDRVNYIFMEGYATYLQGAAGKSFNELVLMTADYYKNNAQRDILADISVGYKLNGYLDVSYPIGGLLCQITEESYGFDGISRLFQFGSDEEDFFEAVHSVLGIKKTELSEYILNKLQSR